ncbi:IclR family transcriptional regulator [Arthrobacter sp. 24S4-2]|uniref:IclR family transcriptional regulator n=1 Tax=Arthrobacter sp. 24S4-2 TaxID=2575374 RepID=UPI001585EEB2|nr:helix-turn-helix domain-containing protein [Arthrobacter sp. 24S4-2]
MSSERASLDPKSNRGVRSQTLERALDALQILADGKRRTSQELADELGLHRSIVYRILRTLEDYSLIARASDGKYLLGLGMAALAKSGMGDLEVQVAAVLQELSNVTAATAIFCGPQRDDAVVLASTRPSQRPASVAIRTGTRFPLNGGAPGMAILALRDPREDESDETALARQTGIVHTKGQPFVGLEAVSVPIRMPDGQEASLSLLFPVGDAEATTVARELRTYSARLVLPSEVWQH